MLSLLVVGAFKFSRGGGGDLLFSHLVKERDDEPYAGRGDNDESADSSDYEPHHTGPPGF
jgi:hypothetical protein